MHSRARPPSDLSGRSVDPLWLLIAVMLVLVVVGFWMLGMSLDVSNGGSLVLLGGSYAAVAYYYERIRKDEILGPGFVISGQLFVVLFLGLILTYPVCAIGLPYRDAELYAVDRWLGFDRMAYVTAVANIPALNDVMHFAYLSIRPQSALLPCLLVFAGQPQRLRMFVLAFGVALLLTNLVSIFVPAVAAAAFVDRAHPALAALADIQASHVPTLEALRSGAMKQVQVSNLDGLLTFPSFHTAIAILFAWAAWPVWYARWPFAILNGLMIASTPTSGQHYFIDIVGGAVVAVVGIWVARRVLISRTDRPAILQSSAVGT